MNQIRYFAASAIHAVLKGHSLGQSLEPYQKKLADLRDRAFLHTLCYGVCRFYPRLKLILELLLEKPLREKDGDVYALLLVGIYQLGLLKISAHAAVKETVNALTNMKKPWARGLVNAVLRNYLRNSASIDQQLENNPIAFYAHPLWWIEAIKKSWPNDWQAILKANNEIAPLTLRVNTRHITRENYLNQLSAANIKASALLQTEAGITLDAPHSVERLPGYQAGDFLVQDGAAQLAAPLLAGAKKMRVLDACAAPGGKLTHILTLYDDLAACVAMDSNRLRLQIVSENLARLGLSAELLCADVREGKKYFADASFDRILLDAPCSASGVIRRHPDIKLLRKESDVPVIAALQYELLNALWPLLKPEGILLYATCSLLAEENWQVIQQFLATHPDAKEYPIETSWGIACRYGKQILPGMDGMDGFYYARLRKG